MRNTVQQTSVHKLDGNDWATLKTLWDRCFPSSAQQTPAAFARRQQDRIRRFAWRDRDERIHRINNHAGEPIALASSFRRTVSVGTQAMNVLALARVATSPDYRFRGLGVLVVRDALSRCDGVTTYCLFQTGVPHFYQRLDCQLLPASSYDGGAVRREGSGFWDPYIMVYAPQQLWPQGAINLRGPGY